MDVIEQLRALRRARPFVPFIIRDTEKREFWVPTWDYFAVPPGATRVIVFVGEGDNSVSIQKARIDSIETLPLD
jgi:hypothetical protein